MKKIINYKKYDTDTAKLIGYCHNGAGTYWEEYEALYLKSTGEFFYHGYGGAASKFGERRGNRIYSSSCILPYSVEEAKEWVIKHMSRDDYKNLFGNVEE